MLDIFKNGWTAAHTNDKISFEIECSCLAVQYRKSVQQPVPKAKAVIDGDEAHAVIWMEISQRTGVTAFI